jgi:pyroglutamyl-peptidase
MRMLIYGFGPYRHYQKNVTEKIVRKLPRRRWLKKLIFPVRFHRSRFIRAVKEHRPDVILGLGQCSTGRRLRVETRAVNKRREYKGEKPRPIVSAGARKLLTNLELKLGRQARSSADAGEYVCNYSMYVVLHFLKRRRLPARFGFIHVPHDYEPWKAARILLAAVGKIKSAG